MNQYLGLNYNMNNKSSVNQLIPNSLIGFKS